MEGIKTSKEKNSIKLVCLFGMSSNSVLLNAKDRFFFYENGETFVFL